MSAHTQAVVLSGYQISYEAYCFGLEYYENHDQLPYEWEDLFVASDETYGAYFFGEALVKLADDDIPMCFEIDSLLASRYIIEKVQYAFDTLVRPYYEENNLPLPEYKKWLFLRVV